jgi:hypothetical protein
MHKKTSTLLAVLSVFIVSVIFVVPAWATPAPPPPPSEQIDYVVYEKSPALFELTAARGQTVKQNVDMPVTYVLKNGTRQQGYETTTVTLVNSINPAKSLVGPLTVITWATCSANMNSSHGYYTGAVDWHYDGTSAWHDRNYPRTWVAVSPYVKDVYFGSPSSPTGPGASHYITTSASFKWVITQWTIVYEYHDLYFTVYGNGSCTAGGGIH